MACGSIELPVPLVFREPWMDFFRRSGFCVFENIYCWVCWDWGICGMPTRPCMVLYIPKFALGLVTPRSRAFLVIFMVPAAVWITLILPVLSESVLYCRVLKF